MAPRAPRDKDVSPVAALVASLQKRGKGALSAAKRRALVRDHGVDAVRALLAAEHPKWTAAVVELGASDSPWPYAGESALATARRALGPLADRLPRTLAKLGTAELVVTARHTPDASGPDLGGWFLLYAVPADHGPELWIGGPPAPDAAIGIDGWSLPEPLRELYAQHHGLGVLCDEFGWTGVDPGAQPAPHLTIPSVAELDAPNAPARTDLLRFTRGTGEAGESGWCFVRGSSPSKRRKAKNSAGAGEAPTPGALAIRHLDDQFGLLGEPAPFDFWGFLDRYLTGDADSELPFAEHF